MHTGQYATTVASRSISEDRSFARTHARRAAMQGGSLDSANDVDSRSGPAAVRRCSMSREWCHGTYHRSLDGVNLTSTFATLRLRVACLASLHMPTRSRYLQWELGAGSNTVAPHGKWGSGQGKGWTASNMQRVQFFCLVWHGAISEHHSADGSQAPTLLSEASRDFGRWCLGGV